MFVAEDGKPTRLIVDTLANSDDAIDMVAFVARLMLSSSAAEEDL
jgi:hypothetical protein